VGEGLNHYLVDGPLDRLELALELAVLRGGDARGDDRSRYVASTPQGRLGLNEDVRNVLFFTKQGKMQENFEGFRVGSENDEFSDTTIQGFRGLVGALFELLVLSGLIDKLQDLIIQVSFGRWPSLATGRWVGHSYR